MAIVLVPGFMMDAEMWSDIAPELAPFGPLHYADPRGATSIRDMAETVLAQAPPSFALIGFSMGGYVAREMVRLAPDRVNRLVLIATSARGDDETQAQRKAAAADVPFAGISKASIRRSLAPERETDVALVQRIQDMGLRLGGETFRRQLRFRRGGDLASLSGIKCPTLIVGGRQDRLRSLDEIEELHRGISKSAMTIIEAGHMIPMEVPSELSAALRRFLRA